MRTDMGIIDVMVQSHFGHESIELPIPRALLRDRESLSAWPSLGVVAHMFGDAGEREREASNPDTVVALFDRLGIESGQVPVYPQMTDEQLDTIGSSGRFFGTLRVDPHAGYQAVAELDRLARQRPWIRSVSIMPSIQYPIIPPDSREYYPIYSKCVELGLPVMLNVGFPGPRIPGEAQRPMHLEHVAWFFPELQIVMKHGGAPWVDECVALLRKWPNLHYATTAYAPSKYPSQILDYMRTSKRHRVVYGGYYPSIGLDRILAELAEIDLPDAAAERFLRSNARDLFALKGQQGESNV